MQDQNTEIYHSTVPDLVPGSIRPKGSLKRKFVLGVTIIIVPVIGLLFTPSMVTKKFFILPATTGEGGQK